MAAPAWALNPAQEFLLISSHQLLSSPRKKYLAPCHTSVRQPWWVEEGDCGSIGVLTIIPHHHSHIQLQGTPHQQGLQARCWGRRQEMILGLGREMVWRWNTEWGGRGEIGDRLSFWAQARNVRESQSKSSSFQKRSWGTRAGLREW